MSGIKISSDDEKAQELFIQRVIHYTDKINEITEGEYNILEKNFQNKLKKVTKEEFKHNYNLACYYAVSEGTRDCFYKSAPNVELDKDTNQCRPFKEDLPSIKKCGLCLRDLDLMEELLCIKNCSHVIHKKCLTYEVTDFMNYTKLPDLKEHQIDCILCHILHDRPIINLAVIKLDDNNT